MGFFFFDFSVDMVMSDGRRSLVQGCFLKLSAPFWWQGASTMRLMTVQSTRMLLQTQ